VKVLSFARKISPLSGVSLPTSREHKVVFPEPFEPTMPTREFACNSQDSSVNIGFAPNDLEIDFAVKIIMGVFPPRKQVQKTQKSHK